VFDALQLAAGEERCKRGGDLAGIVVADERTGTQNLVKKLC